jgi:hypothetical protein
MKTTFDAVMISKMKGMGLDPAEELAKIIGDIVRTEVRNYLRDNPGRLINYDLTTRTEIV